MPQRIVKVAPRWVCSKVKAKYDTILCYLIAFAFVLVICLKITYVHVCTLLHTSSNFQFLVLIPCGEGGENSLLFFF